MTPAPQADTPIPRCQHILDSPRLGTLIYYCGLCQVVCCQACIELDHRRTHGYPDCPVEEQIANPMEKLRILLAPSRATQRTPDTYRLQRHQRSVS